MLINFYNTELGPSFNECSLLIVIARLSRKSEPDIIFYNCVESVHIRFTCFDEIKHWLVNQFNFMTMENKGQLPNYIPIYILPRPYHLF